MSLNNRPNIVKIIVHDIGQHIGSYGAGVDTPNMDRMAEDGISFDQYACTAAQCSPSRGSIMTGRYPHENGLMGLAHIGWEFHPGQKTLPMYMSEAGYETHLFGVQHEHSDPSTLGYDYLHDTDEVRARYVTDNMLEFLRDRAENPGSKPFYMSCGFAEPHRPYQREGYPMDNPDSVQIQPWLPDRPGIREDIAGLNGLVQVVDDQVGRVRDVLHETGLEEDTLFIFTTDHGTAQPRAKGTCYDPGIMTALIMHQPGVIEGGTVHSELLTNCDFLPTMMEMVGGPDPDDISGRSFWQLIAGGDYEERDHIFAEMTWHDRYNPMRAIRTNDFLYVRNFGDRPMVYLPLDVWNGKAGSEVAWEYYKDKRPEHQLYDLTEDSLQMNDVAEEDEYADTLEELKAMVEEWMVETDDPLLLGPVPPPPEQAHREATRWQPN